MMADSSQPNRLLRTLHRWRGLVFIACIAWVSAALGFARGPAATTLGLAAGALLLTIFAAWQSIRTLFGDEDIPLGDELALAMEAQKTEQKRAVLKAIEDLKYEHEVGKIDEADYQQTLKTYRSRAKALLKKQAGPSKQDLDEAEALWKARSDGRGREDEQEQVVECPKCERENDHDAAFCKSCGKALTGDADGPEDESAAGPEEEEA